MWKLDILKVEFLKSTKSNLTIVEHGSLKSLMNDCLLNSYPNCVMRKLDRGNKIIIVDQDIDIQKTMIKLIVLHLNFFVLLTSKYCLTFASLNK